MNHIYTILLSIILLYSGALQAQDRKLIVASSNNAHEFAPDITTDGTYMYFQSNTKDGFKIYVIKTDTKSSMEEVPIPLETSGFTIIGGPSYCNTDSTLYFCAQKSKSGNDLDIYFTKKYKGVWQKPELLNSSINTKDYEGFPSISDDGRMLFFERKDATDSDYCFQFYQSLKDTITNTWLPAKKVIIPAKGNCNKQFKLVEWNGLHSVFFSKSPGDTSFTTFYSNLNSNGKWSETQNWKFLQLHGEHISMDVDEKNNKVYFSEYGNLYEQKIPFDYWVNNDITLAVQLVNKENNRLLDEGQLDVYKIINSDTILYTHQLYKAQNTLLKLTVKDKYLIKATSNGYTQEIPFVFNILKEPETLQLVQPILMSPKKVEVMINVTDQESGQGLPVEIQITDLETGEKIILDVTLNKDGKYALNLREGGSYNVEISSQQGYAFVNTQVDVPLNSRSRTSSKSSGTAKATYSATGIIEYTIEVKPIKKGTSLVLKDIYFGSNSIQITKESYEELNRVVELMKDNPDIKIEIAAHTDDIGSDAFNNKLSLQRAQSIVVYLSSKGISEKRLIAKGYGKTKPITSNTTEEGRALNRRVELKVIEVKK